MTRARGEQSRLRGQKGRTEERLGAGQLSEATPRPEGRGFRPLADGQDFHPCPISHILLRFATGGHSSPGLKARGFLTGFDKENGVAP